MFINVIHAVIVISSLEFLVLTLLNTVHKYVHTYIHVQDLHICARHPGRPSLVTFHPQIVQSEPRGPAVASKSRYMYIHSLRELTWRPAFWKICKFRGKINDRDAWIFAEQTGIIQDEFMGERLRGSWESEPVHPVHGVCVFVYISW